MFKRLTALALIASCASFALPAHGCDMHGAGFGGFGSAGAHWKPYSPAPNTTKYKAPEEKEEKAEKAVEEAQTPKPLVDTPSAKKPRPSFSNAANRASKAAKKSLAQKSEPPKRG